MGFSEVDSSVVSVHATGVLGASVPLRLSGFNTIKRIRLPITLNYWSKHRFAISDSSGAIRLVKKEQSAFAELCIGVAIIFAGLNIMLPIIALGGSISAPSSLWRSIFWCASGAMILMALHSQWRKRPTISVKHEHGVLHINSARIEISELNRSSVRLCRVIGQDEPATFKKPSEWLVMVYVSKGKKLKPVFCEKIQWRPDRDRILDVFRRVGVSFDFDPSVAYVLIK